MGAQDRFCRWYRYEQDAQRNVLSMLESVPEDRRQESAFQQALDKFAHVLAARNMWLARLGAEHAGDADLFPNHARLEDLGPRLDATHRLWERFLEQLDDTEIAAMRTYTAHEGDVFSNRLEDILIQLHGHALYHGGQIAMLVRQCGGDPRDTDFIYWSRQPMQRESS